MTSNKINTADHSAGIKPIAFIKRQIYLLYRIMQWSKAKKKAFPLTSSTLMSDDFMIDIEILSCIFELLVFALIF